MSFEKALEAAVARAASAGLGELGRFLDPDQESASVAQLREAQRTFSRTALLHCRTMLLFMDSLKQLPQLYDAFAASLAERGVSITDFEQTAREGIVRFQPKG